MKIAELTLLMTRLAREASKHTFLLREMSTLAGDSKAAVAMTLGRAAKQKLVARVGNLWLNLLDPPDLTEIALALSSPSYISLESALYRRGIISQSPRGGLTVVTPTRGRQVDTPLGPIRFFHLKPDLIFGFDKDRIAMPEKAWLDLLYLRGRKGRSGTVITERVYWDRLKNRRLAEFERTFPSWVGELRRSMSKKRPPP